MSAEDIEWFEVPAGQLRPGDRTKWGYGDAMRNSFRTVSQVKPRGNGIVAVYHHETWARFYDEYAENYPVTIARRT